MVGWMDDEALHRTLTTGRATYWCREPSGVLGQGRHLRARPAGQVGRASTATATPCWSRSTRSAPPATPATAPASTPAPGRGRRCVDDRPPELGYGVTWPSLEEFRELARDRRVIPVTRTPARRRRDPGRALPQAGRATARARSCSSRPSTAASWSRYSFVGVRSRGPHRARRRRGLDRRAAGGVPDRRAIRWRRCAARLAALRTPACPGCRR